MPSTSLRAKIVAMALTVAVVASAAFGVAAYLGSSRLAEELATAQLLGETRLLTEQITGAFRVMATDTGILGTTPPIQGIARSIKAGGVDPLDGSSLLLWKTRLSSIFQSVLEARPEYTQIRYIGLSDGGRELVRVERQGREIISIPDPHLQSKVSEPYFQTAIRLPPGQIGYSEITLNREYGTTDQRRIPTIRSLLSIRDEEDRLFGILVINADFERMLRATLRKVRPKHETIIANGAGAYLTYESNGAVSPMALREDGTYVPHRALSFIDRTGPDQIARDAHNIYVLHTLKEADTDSPELTIISYSPRTLVDIPVARTRQTVVLITCGLLVVVLGFGLVASRHVTRPLARMTGAVERFREDPDTHTLMPNLPVDQSDEIGALARAFSAAIAQVQDNKEKLRAIVDNVADGLIVIGADSRIQVFNPACEAMFHYRRDDVLGQDVTLLMPDDLRGPHHQGIGTHRRGMVSGVIGHTVEVPARRKDGSRFEAELSVSELDTTGEILYCGIIRDITNRKRIERMKDEFVSTVNHEIRTPLTSIHGSLSLLKALAGGSLDDRGKRLLELAASGTERLGRLVNDILDSEKIAAGRMEYHIESLDLIPHIRDITCRQEALAEKWGVSFRVETAAETIPVNVDPDRFEQAMVNLLSNAARYSHKGGEVLVTMDKGADTVTLRVIDHGTGIPLEFQSCVFDRFSQADSSGSAQKGSSGLGLHITKTLIEVFGGTITFDSTEGVGTTFEITLPLAASAGA